MEIKNEGICRSCLKTFAGRSMGRHLAACKAKQQQEEQATQKKRTIPIYHLKISAYPPFWLHIEMPTKAKLHELDNFLRGIWLECCGHLSEFTIHGMRYMSTTESDGWGLELEAESMNIPLNKILGLKDQFEYDYDFGSTTGLKGQVVSQRQGVLNEKIRILARNNLPHYPCTDCSNLATKVAVEEYELYCDQCFDKHGFDEDMWLPVVNSPRMGVCGYDGDNDIDDFELS